GRRSGWRRRKNVVEQVFSADRGRRPGRIGRYRQNGRFAEQTETVLVGERDGPEMAAIDTRDSVMPRELFVEKRLVRRQQIQDAAIPLQLGIEEQLHFLDERDPQVVVEPGK